MNLHSEPIYEEKYQAMLQELVLRKFADEECRIFLFGSRARGDYRRDSDYDIGFQNVNARQFLLKKSDLEIELEESIIPHHVDFINFDEVDETFVRIVGGNVIVWKN